jgi:uncharacterized protein YrzB (UPF0473 family)
MSKRDKGIKTTEVKVETIELIDDEGGSLTFELLSTIEKDGETYLVVTPFVEDETEVDFDIPAEIFIMCNQTKGENDKLTLQPVKDPKIVVEIFRIFKEQTKDKYDFEDESYIKDSEEVKEEQEELHNLFYQLNPFVQLQYATLKTDKPYFSEAVDRFLVKYKKVTLAERFFLMSLLEYLYDEAPKDEQNLFMVVELIEAGLHEETSESDLERLFQLLEEKYGQHIAKRHFENFKTQASKEDSPDTTEAIKETDAIIKACRKHFAPIGKPDDFFKYFKRERDARIVADLIVTTYNGEPKNSVKLSNYLWIKREECRINNEKCGYKDIDIDLPEIKQLKKFYSGF